MKRNNGESVGEVGARFNNLFFSHWSLDLTGREKLETEKFRELEAAVFFQFRVETEESLDAARERLPDVTRRAELRDVINTCPGLQIRRKYNTSSLSGQILRGFTVNVLQMFTGKC